MERERTGGDTSLRLERKDFPLNLGKRMMASVIAGSGLGT